MTVRRFLPLLLLVACGAAGAADKTLYKCRAADGSLAFQEEPCAGAPLEVIPIAPENAKPFKLTDPTCIAMAREAHSELTRPRYVWSRADWDGLKRTLRSGQVRIESLAELVGLSSTVQLEPEPLPLDLKVILIGERMIYYLLAELDPDFLSLFKINADLESEITRTPDGTAQYARLVATLAHRDGLRIAGDGGACGHQS